MEPGVPDPVPALNAPTVAHQSQQCIWGGAQVCEELVGRPKWLAITAAIGGHLHDPAGANPRLANMFLFRTQYPGYVATVADFLTRCHKRDLAFSLELAMDLATQRPLVGFEGQEEVGPLLQELPKNGLFGDD